MPHDVQTHLLGTPRTDVFSATRAEWTSFIGQIQPQVAITPALIEGGAVAYLGDIDLRPVSGQVNVGISLSENSAWGQAGPHFTAGFVTSGRFTISADSLSVEFEIADADMAEPYRWAPANYQSEIVPFLAAYFAAGGSGGDAHDR